MGEDSWTVQIRLSASGDELFAHAVLLDGPVAAATVTSARRCPSEPALSARARVARRALAELAASLRSLELAAPAQVPARYAAPRAIGA